MKRIEFTEKELDFIAKYERMAKMFAIWERTEEEAKIEEELTEKARDYMDENDLWDDIEKPTFTDMILWYRDQYTKQEA